MTDKATENGSFSAKHAAKKDWKLDAGLQRAIQMSLAGGVRHVVDIGAGVGKYVEWLRDECRVEALGLDGIPGVGDLSNGLVEECDLTGVLSQREFDLGVCAEVGEHIPLELTEQFIANITSIVALRLLVSWAVPNQRGRNHINCQSPEWVANAFGRHGWQLQWDATEQLRKIAGKGWDHKLLFFHR